jgi:hypothetical protein
MLFDCLLKSCAKNLEKSNVFQESAAIFSSVEGQERKVYVKYGDFTQFYEG